MPPRKHVAYDSIDDPFNFLAQGINIDEEHHFDEMPVGIRQFIEDKNFLNLKWDGKSGCRPKIMEIAIAITEDNVREAMLILGKGSGKDFISSILHLYGIYKCLCMTSPQKYYGMAPGSSIYFVNCARNEEQAKRVFFAEFKGMLENCPWFEGKYTEPAANSIRFAKRVVALSATSQAFSWLGYNTIQWVGDELAFFLVSDGDEESESRAEECWEAAFGSCQTRFRHHYKMIGITTPRFDDDFVMRKYHELSSRNDSFTARAATWEMNPLLTIEDFKYAMERNYRRTMRDFGAQPMGSIESFWADAEFVEENVCESCRQCIIWQNRKLSEDNWECWDNTECMANPYIGNGNWREWFAPDLNAEYYMHFDLSKNKDRVGFTIGHIMDYVKLELDNFQLMEKYKLNSLKDMNKEDRYEERPLIKIDSIGFIDPKSKRDDEMLKNKEIYYEAILRKIVRWLLDRGFNIVKVTTDQYQSHQFKQALEDMGVETELISLDRNDEIPVAAKTSLVENRVEYPYSRIMAREAKNLKYINGKKVDHAKKESKDVIDSVFGVIYECEVCDLGGGTFLGYE
jgi:hypothetical protein